MLFFLQVLAAVALVTSGLVLTVLNIKRNFADLVRLTSGAVMFGIGAAAWYDWVTMSQRQIPLVVFNTAFTAGIIGATACGIALYLVLDHPAFAMAYFTLCTTDLALACATNLRREETLYGNMVWEIVELVLWLLSLCSTSFLFAMTRPTKRAKDM
ncbi:MAG TPA: hypothetical protein VFO38_02750 [Candidatus Saccharimonadales bacterium]|nr:hypothetical protein [Candidatus Saccharimonadales bacterium]